MLRNDESGLAIARFFSPLNANTRVTLAGLPDADLTAAHRVFGALIDAAVLSGRIGRGAEILTTARG